MANTPNLSSDSSLVRTEEELVRRRTVAVSRPLKFRTLPPHLDSRSVGALGRRNGASEDGGTGSGNYKEEMQILIVQWLSDKTIVIPIFFP